MNKAVMLSIRPKWVEKIANGEKTIEVRKTRPNLPTPFKCYIYCTKNGKDSDRLWVLREQIRKEYDGLSAVCANLRAQPDLHSVGNGYVVGEFVCDKIDNIRKRGIPENYDYCYLSLNEWGNDDIETEIRDIRESCIPKETLNAYAGEKPMLYAWHISKLEIYDTPKELNEFWFPPELYCKKERCGGCLYDQVADVNGEYSFDCEWKRPLTRPPQSWCYVEAMKDG